jgi:hypothetical protein
MASCVYAIPVHLSAEPKVRTLKTGQTVGGIPILRALAETTWCDTAAAVHRCTIWEWPVSRLPGRMVSSTPDAWTARALTFQSLPETVSLFPGNGIARPETTRPKRAGVRHWSLQRLEAERQSPPIRGYSPDARKSPQTQECVVGPGEVAAASNVKDLRLGAGVSGPLMRKRNFRRCPHQPTPRHAGSDPTWGDLILDRPTNLRGEDRRGPRASPLDAKPLLAST